MAIQREETYRNGVLISTRDVTVPLRQANEDDLRQKAEAALTANATFMALANPTNAQILAQVQRLTRQSAAIIRLTLGLLDDTAGT